MSGFVSLEDFVPQLSPRFMAPRHLRPLTALFERIAEGETVKAVVSCPPRHSKTETMLHAIPWLLCQDPTLQIGYASYGSLLSKKKSRRARELSKLAGVPLASDSKSKVDWRTGEEEGGVWATSVGGAITGEGFHVMLIDDPIKGRAEAESGLIRDRAHDWLVADVLTRLEPGASAILSMARWHPDDPAGRLVAEGWEYVNLQAINDKGEPLWPERWKLHHLLSQREAMGGEEGYEWQSLYMGNPRGRGSRVFQDVHSYTERPGLEHAAVSIGLDFAYSTRTAADFSVAVVLAKVESQIYVLDVVRAHDEPRVFRNRVQLLRETYPGARVSAYAAATEMGGVEFIRDGGIPIVGWPAKTDKFSRAIPVTAAWNLGKVLLPQSARWLDAFVSEVCGFTGVKDRHDDQVDALAAAFDGLPRGDVEQPRELTPEERAKKYASDLRARHVAESEDRKRKETSTTRGRYEAIRRAIFKP